ncbi:MAG: PAS domain S-box protein [Actinobacteria bacterium]|nr:PAS domain S-box protein [Actinomycetota bacterium]
MTQPHRPEDFGIGRLFEDIRDAVIVADAKSECILLWNRGAAEMFGYSRDEALSMLLHQLVAPHLVDLHRAGLARYQQNGEGDLVDSGKPVEVEAMRKGGSIFPVELTLNSVKTTSPDDGRRVLALIRDASDRQAAAQVREAQLRQQAALEIHDSIIQGLVVAKTSIELGEQERGLEVLGKTLQVAREMVSQMMAERHEIFGLHPGDFVRTEPASLEPRRKET